MRSGSAIVVGASFGGALAYLGVKTTPANGLFYAVFLVALATFIAGWIARRQGVIAGVAAIVVGAVLWSADVLGRAWLSGDLARTFPDCDPCGLTGYAARMLVVSAMAVGAFGPLAGLCGWLGTVARARVRPGAAAERRGP